MHEGLIGQRAHGRQEEWRGAVEHRARPGRVQKRRGRMRQEGSAAHRGREGVEGERRRWRHGEGRWRGAQRGSNHRVAQHGRHDHAGRVSGLGLHHRLYTCLKLGLRHVPMNSYGQKHHRYLVKGQLGRRRSGLLFQGDRGGSAWFGSDRFLDRRGQPTRHVKCSRQWCW